MQHTQRFARILILLFVILLIRSQIAHSFEEPANALLREASWLGYPLNHSGLFYRYYEEGDPFILDDGTPISEAGQWVLHSDDDTGVAYATRSQYLEGENLIIVKDGNPPLTLVERWVAIIYGESQVGVDYSFGFFPDVCADAKNPGHSFRCDGFLEYCYEMAGRDITVETWESNPLPGCWSVHAESTHPCCNAPTHQFNQFALGEALPTIPWIEYFYSPVQGEYYSGAVPLHVQGDDNYEIAATKWMYSTDGDTYTEIVTLYEGANQYGLPDDNDEYTWEPPSSGNYYVRAYVIDMGGHWSAPQTVHISYSSNTCPVLSEADITPTNIETQEYCLFEVVYRDEEGDLPGIHDLVIDGNRRYAMSPQPPYDYVNGVLYTKSLPGSDLGCGNHQHHFEFTGGCGQTVHYPESGDFDGPGVEGSEPWLRILEPDGDDYVDSSDPNPTFSIQWVVCDPDSSQGDELTLDLYWDTDTNPDNGFYPIVSGIDAGDGHCNAGSYPWDLSPLDDGVYYVCGIVEDECGVWDDDYCDGPLLLDDDVNPCTDVWRYIETPFASQSLGYKAILDSDDSIHLIFVDSEDGYTLKHSVSHDFGESWSTPVSISSTDAHYDMIDACISGSTLDVIFCKYPSTYEVYHCRSDDLGSNWSSAHAISTNDGDASRGPRISYANGTIHATWVEINYPPHGFSTIVYSRSTDGGNSWSSSTAISDPSVASLSLPTDAPTIACDGSYVHIAFTHNGLDAAYYRRSTNSGSSWDAPVLLSESNDHGAGSLCITPPYVYFACEDGDADAVFFASSSNNGSSFSPAGPITFDNSWKHPSLCTMNASVFLMRESPSGSTDALYFSRSNDHGENWCIGSQTFQEATELQDRPVCFSNFNYAGVAGRRGSDLRVMISITPPPAPLTGLLTVLSEPIGCSIYIDDSNTGEFTPHEFELDEGMYEVALTHYGCDSDTTLVTINAGESTELSTILDCCPMSGDIDANGSLTPGDALCAFEIQLNGQEVPPDCNFDGDCEVFTADVNCDGQVTAADADAIFQRYLYDLPPEDCFNRNYEPIPIQEILLAGTRQQDAESEFEVKISARSSMAYGCFGLEISYPAELLRFIRAVPLEGTEEWIAVEARALSHGTIIVTGFAGGEAQYAKPGQSPLVKLQFEELQELDEQSVIEVLHLYDSATDAEVLGSPLPLVDQILTELSLYFQNPTASGSNQVYYSLPSEFSGDVHIKVFDVSGRLTTTLISAPATEGAHSLIWDGSDSSGDKLAAGIYFMRLEAGSKVLTKKLVVLK